MKKTICIILLVWSNILYGDPFFRDLRTVGYSDAIYIGKLNRVNGDLVLTNVEALNGRHDKHISISCENESILKKKLDKYERKKVIIFLNRVFGCGYKISNYKGRYGLITYEKTLAQEIKKSVVSGDWIYNRLVLGHTLNNEEMDDYHKSIIKLYDSKSYKDGIKELLGKGDKYTPLLIMDLMRAYKHMTTTGFINLSADKSPCGASQLFDALSCVLSKTNEYDLSLAGREFNGLWRLRVLNSWSYYGVVRYGEIRGNWH